MFEAIRTHIFLGIKIIIIIIIRVVNHEIINDGARAATGIDLTNVRTKTEYKY